MKLFPIARVQPRLVAHAPDRVGIETPQIAGGLGQAPPHGHGAGPTLLERGVVQEGVRPAVQDLVGQG